MTPIHGRVHSIRPSFEFAEQVQEFFPNPRHSSLVCFVGKASEMILTNSLTQQSINLSGFLTKPTIKN